MSGLISDAYKSDSDSDDEKVTISTVVETQEVPKVPEKKVAVFKLHVKKDLDDDDDKNGTQLQENEQDQGVKSLSDLLPAPKKLKKTKPQVPDRVVYSSETIKPKRTLEIAPSIETDDSLEESSDEKVDKDVDFVGPEVPSYLRKRRETQIEQPSIDLSNQCHMYQEPTNYHYQSLNYLPEQYRPKGHELESAMLDSNWTTINASDLQKSKLYLTDEDILEHEKAARRAISGFTRVSRQKSHITYLSAIAKSLEENSMNTGKYKRTDLKRKPGT